jgi:hypothetical protein
MKRLLPVKIEWKDKGRSSNYQKKLDGAKKYRCKRCLQR